MGLFDDEMLDWIRAVLISWGSRMLQGLIILSAGNKKDETLSWITRGLISWGDAIIARFLKTCVGFDSLRLIGCNVITCML